jgi:uncharacterized membrane protein
LLRKDVLLPAAATTAAAIASAYAARKLPELARRAAGSTEDAAEELGREGARGATEGLSEGSGGLGGLATKAASKVAGGGGSGSGGGKRKTRRLPIQRWTDVAVPVDVAYRLWTDFEEFPKFMHRVLNVHKEGRDQVAWDQKIWFSRRHWEGKITDRRKNDRVAWKTIKGMSHSGIVSFHPIGPRLTRVMVTMDFVPQGVVEKMASGLRFVKRAVQSDLARFKAYAEMEDARGLEYGSGSDGDAPQEAEAKQRSGSSNGSGNRDSARKARQNRRKKRAAGRS